jgi:hypothetical protein
MTRKKASNMPTGELLQRIRRIWESARSQAVRSINAALVQANWLIGQQIVDSAVLSAREQRTVALLG